MRVSASEASPQMATAGRELEEAAGAGVRVAVSEASPQRAITRPSPMKKKKNVWREEAAGAGERVSASEANPQTSQYV